MNLIFEDFKRIHSETPRLRAINAAIGFNSDAYLEDMLENEQCKGGIKCGELLVFAAMHNQELQYNVGELLLGLSNVVVTSTYTKTWFSRIPYGIANHRVVISLTFNRDNIGCILMVGSEMPGEEEVVTERTLLFPVSPSGNDDIMLVARTIQIFFKDTETMIADVESRFK
jgi:hypothetical protein